MTCEPCELRSSTVFSCAILGVNSLSPYSPLSCSVVWWLVLNVFFGVCGLLSRWKMTDAIYVRGWDDCLEAVSLMMAQTDNIEGVKKKIGKLRVLIREDKFEKIRYELGAFDIF
jgi:hypothetical protein